MTTPVELKEVRVSMMNVVHDLALLVARDEGFFRDEGLDVEIVSTPGTAQVNADHQALQAQIFDRTMESLYNTGAVDQYRMCEWGVMKRTVEAADAGQRPAKIVALGAAMSKMAIITGPKSPIYDPEQLKNTPVAAGQNARLARHVLPNLAVSFHASPKMELNHRGRHTQAQAVEPRACPNLHRPDCLARAARSGRCGSRSR